MKVEEIPFQDDPIVFVPFRLAITVKDADELIALTMAAGKMCNGHGLELYPLLKAKCERFGIDIP